MYVHTPDTIIRSSLPQGRPPQAVRPSTAVASLTYLLTKNVSPRFFCVCFARLGCDMDQKCAAVSSQVSGLFCVKPIYGGDKCFSVGERCIGGDPFQQCCGNAECVEDGSLGYGKVCKGPSPRGSSASALSSANSPSAAASQKLEHRFVDYTSYRSFHGHRHRGVGIPSIA